jgi:hypothetical protein
MKLLNTIDKLATTIGLRNIEIQYFGRTKATITGRSNENQELESA